METGQIARRFRWIMAVLITGGLALATPADVRAGSTGSEIQTVKVGDILFEFVRIPAGRFVMGSSSGSRDERPAHEVSIGDGLYMGRTEVSVRQFRAFVEATGYKTDAERIGWAYTCPLPGMHPHERGLEWRRPGFELTDEHPAVVLSRADAVAFCRWWSEQTGRTCRLPTEAEWEYAARAGRQDDSGGLDDAAWHEENASDSAHAVATKAANPWGLYDMQGNVWEWCLDVWQPNYEGAALDGGPRMSDPTIPPAAWRYVLRGGGWASPREHLRYGRRHRGLVSFASPATGFRLVLDPEGRMSNSVAHADSTAGKEDRMGRGPAHPTSPALSPSPGSLSDAKDSGGHLTAGLDVTSACPRERGQGTLSTDSGTGRTILATGGVQFEFVRIPAGEFLMGMEEGSIEKPVHKVRIGYDFEMARTEVTVAQFRAFAEATGYLTDGEKAGTGGARRDGQDWQTESEVSWRDTTFPQTDEDPVTFVSWYDAMAFCHWLSAETGQEVRLPSESEWEYACRAGTTGAYAGAVSDMGWSQYNSCGRTHPVARKQPNPWGLYDMHGNVWEWCLDFFTTSYEGAPADGSPRWDLRPASDVVSRGGSFVNPPGWLGSAVRMGSFPDCSHYNNGFRLVRVLTEPRRSVTRTHVSVAAKQAVEGSFVEVGAIGLTEADSVRE